MRESATAEEPMEGFTDFDSDEDVGVEPETALAEEAAANARCVYCGDGMIRGELPKFNRGFGIIVLVLGLMLSIFMMLFLGLPMVVIGAYMVVASRSVWTCPGCRAMVERHAG